MSARIFLILTALIRQLYQGILHYLQINQRKKPLPEEVSDIYDQERYKTFMSYKNETMKLHYIQTIVSMGVEIILILSPIFSIIEKLASGNVYLVAVITWFIYWIIETIISLPFFYYNTFTIEEKYGQNKRTKKEFRKDVILEIVEEIPISIGMILLVSFIGEHLSSWTTGFSLSIWKTAVLTAGLVLVFFIFAVVAAVLQIAVMKKQYTFTPLPEGELRNKINGLMKDCKKDIKEIYVYNESKKSVSKNAFLLKFLWHREFGIADNFLNDNEEDELLGVLSHEIGHLKHKKNFLNYINYGLFALIFAFVVYTMNNPALFVSINAWIRNSFDISVNNYYILIGIYGAIIRPVVWLISVFGNYRQRAEEKEADMNAVKEGYGPALIRTFKKLSADELVDVNPHPVIEFLEFDHPGMYQRVKYIQEAVRQNHYKEK